VAQDKTVAELAALDQQDESLQRWKQSLGIGAGASTGFPKKVSTTRSLIARVRNDEADTARSCSKLYFFSHQL
jgi:hypothetical protein